ncbi:MAG: tRNA 2-thiocytidine biosynthesis protein TtcA [Clostridia bacterium]|nr:tRNA 2-thiocytidine biosynthesis protein TtcA [Clostridia bacterium]
MQQILSHMRKAIEEYKMIDERDKIAVCLSGGKDSITLLHGLKALQRFYPKHFDIIAISINPGFEFFNQDLLKEICNNIDVPLFIECNHAKEIVFDIRNEKNPCSLCANLRRGIINSIAIRENCNKIALGHNKDDVLETFILNLLYNGNISTFAPISYMDRSKITLIRPLVLTDEKDIKRYIKRHQIRVMDKVCPIDGKSKREEIKNQIVSWQKNIPMIRANLFGAITRNISEWKIDSYNSKDSRKI